MGDNAANPRPADTKTAADASARHEDQKKRRQATPRQHMQKEEKDPTRQKHNQNLGETTLGKHQRRERKKEKQNLRTKGRKTNQRKTQHQRMTTHQSADGEKRETPENGNIPMAVMVKKNRRREEKGKSRIGTI